MRGDRVTARPSLEALLDREVGELDEVMAEVRAGVRDVRHFDALEERAQSIARGITAAFRSN